MADFKDYIGNFMLVGLFFLAIVFFASGIAVNNGMNQSVTGGVIDTSNVEKQINQTNADSQNWAKAFNSDNLFVALGTVVLYSIWGVGKLIFSSVTTFFNLIIVGLSSIIGIPPIAVGVILSLLLVGLIFSLWRINKVGW